jgi:hypothetical protein
VKVIKLSVIGPYVTFHPTTSEPVGIIGLDNGESLRVFGATCFDALIAHAEQLGHDTADMKLKLDEWVRNGTFVATDETPRSPQHRSHFQAGYQGRFDSSGPEACGMDVSEK